MTALTVSFRNAVVPMENLTVDDKQVEMEIIEISYPDGKVVAFPAHDISPEAGRRYRDIYQAEYQRFKSGEPDPEHVAQLKSDIASKQAELDGLTRAKDDKRVQENLGYGKVRRNPPVTDHETASRDTGRSKTAAKKRRAA